MAQSIVANNSKVCATCNYFICERIPHSAYILVDHSKKGKCLRQPCPIGGYDKNNSQTCVFWTKWGGLR